MHEYFFANYRLLTDDGIANHRSTKRLEAFAAPMPYTHTFTLRLGDVNELEEKRAWALGCPMAYMFSPGAFDLLNGCQIPAPAV